MCVETERERERERERKKKKSGGREEKKRKEHIVCVDVRAGNESRGTYSLGAGKVTIK